VTRLTGSAGSKTRWRAARRAVALLALVTTPFGLNGCDRLVDPKLPDDAELFTPPAVYSTWWQMTEACSGQSGSLDAVTWYKTSQVVHDVRTGEVVAGYWTAGSNRIVLTSTVVMDGGTVRHEMLHALLQKGGHPRDQFLGKCAGTVDCEEACVKDAGSYPNPPETPVEVAGDGIQIGVQVAPATPLRSIDEGRFTVTVLARNLSSHWVTVTPQPPAAAAETFAVEISGANGSTGKHEVAIDLSQRIFAPNEIKRQVFDMVIGDYPFGNQLLPGDYVARASFAGWFVDYAFTIGS
jgi:hypothetical protein